MGHLVWRLSMMTLWTGSKELHSTSDDKIDPNEKATIKNMQVNLYSEDLKIKRNIRLVVCNKLHVTYHRRPFLRLPSVQGTLQLGSREWHPSGQPLRANNLLFQTNLPACSPHYHLFNAERQAGEYQLF